MAFKKGQSGNPGGRPKLPAEIVDVREQAKALTVDAINTLSEVMRSKDAPPSARVTAANALLDRGWGKSEASVTVTTKRDASEYTDDELAAIAAAGSANATGATSGEEIVSSLH